MTWNNMCGWCEDTLREPDSPNEPCHRCRPLPSPLDGLPMGELSNECVSEYLDDPCNDDAFGAAEMADEPPCPKCGCEESGCHETGCLSEDWEDDL